MKQTKTYTVTVTWTGDDVESADRVFEQYLTLAEAPFLTDYAPPAAEGDEREDGYSGPFASDVIVTINEPNGPGDESTGKVD